MGLVSTCQYMVFDVCSEALIASRCLLSFWWSCCPGVLSGREVTLTSNDGERTWTRAIYARLHISDHDL